MATDGNLENLTRSNETLKMASDQCSTVYKLYDRLITEWIICSVGAILNLLCVIVYAHPKQLNSSENFKMRHYILIKSICNAFFLTISSFRGIIDCSSEPYCLASRSEAGQIFNWIVSQYLSYIAKLASMFLESMATIDCFIYISRRFKFYHKINYIVVIVVIFSFCSLFYVFKFYQYFLATSWKNTTNETRYLLERRVSRDLDALVLVHSFLRDFVTVLIIILFNVLIVLTLHKAMTRKRVITHHATSKRNEIRLALMVTLTGVIAVLGHFPLFYRNFASVSSDCFSFVSNLFFHLSYSIGFFFYLYSDHLFKEQFFKLFKISWLIERRRKSKSTVGVG